MSSSMRPRLSRKIQHLNNQLLALGTLVEENLHLAVKALETRSIELAQKVFDGDLKIDRDEVDLEEQCLEILALHQPVAVDLRHIVAVLKINKDLERAGDLAVNIANATELLCSEERISIPYDYQLMALKSKAMLKRSLDAFVNSSLELAYQVLADDDEVDQMKRNMQEQFNDRVQEDPAMLKPLTSLFLVSRHLERIADLATNIAEEVIYIVTGDIVRHGRSAETNDEDRKKARKWRFCDRSANDPAVQ